MAAYSVLISLRETLKDFIQSNPHQILESRNGRHLFESLQQNVIYMQELFDKHHREVGKWEEKIHDSCNEAESIIEDYVARTIRRKGELLREWLYCICECEKQSSLHSQIYRTGAVIDSIVNEMKSELGDSEEKSNSGDDSYRRNFSHLNQVPQKQRLFGFKGHLEEIKKRLLYGNSKELQVVAIVGMGGIGKTSLAGALFDDESIVKHFDLRRWVKVSQSYDAKAILLAILGSENLSCDTNVQISHIGDSIHKLFYRRKYLIVLDDIWESEAWDKVRMHLPDCETNSRVLLTTRNEDVARYTKALKPIYDLKLLDKGTSWSMLKHMVFREEDCPSEFVEIGQEIAEGCHGLPLAIVVIAGILVNVNRTRNSWDKIANDVSKVVETGDEKFSEVLALSYYHLPHYLRPYFLFMTIRRSLNITNLVNCLTPERFFKPNKSHECDRKEIILECLNELVDRNLIIVAERKYNGKVMSYGIHDLIKDLIIKVVKEEKFFHGEPFVGAEEIISTTRRAHFHENPLLNGVNQLHLRSVICCSKDILATLERCHHLRILISHVSLPLNMLSERLELCHLRHLHLEVSKDESFAVSSAISTLVNLEYLAIFCDTVVTIDIWKLPKLCYFHVSPAVMLRHPVVKTSSPFLNLWCLTGIGNFRFSKDTVKLIPNARRIVVLYSASLRAESCSNFGFENLCHLAHLEQLKLVFNSGSYELMNYVTFPSSLKSLSLVGEATKVTWEDITKKIGSLPNLEKLRLRGHAVCGGNVWEINEGYFKKLQVLEVSQSCLKYWKTDGSGGVFPNLKRLILITCPFLTDLPDDIGDTLELILVDDYQEAIVNWATQIQQDQSVYGNEIHIRVLKIDAELKKCRLEKRTKLKKYEEKKSKLDHRVGEAPMDERIEDWDMWVNSFEQGRDDENKLFQVLLAKIGVELVKFKPFELDKSNKSRAEAFQVTVLRIDKELNKYEEEEKEYKMFYRQEVIKFFRDVLLKVVEVLKKYDKEESEEEKMRYHQEAYMLVQSLADRTIEEMYKPVKEEKKKYVRYLNLRRYLRPSYADDNEDQEKDEWDEEEEYGDEKFLKMHTYLRHIYFDDNGDQELKKYEEKKSNEDEMFEEKENREYGEALDLWVKFEQDRPDNRNKLFRVLFAKVVAELMNYQPFKLGESNKSKIDYFWRSTANIVAVLKKFKEVDKLETLSVKVGQDGHNGNKPFEVSISINVADLKKYMEKKSKEDEMFDHPMGETPTALQMHDQPGNGGVLFQVLIAKIAAELMKYQPFELRGDNKSKTKVFWKMSHGIFTELAKYEEEEKEQKTFYHQEAIELFRDIVLKIFEVLKKYREEESEEQKMCYYQEAYKLLRVIVLRIVLETGKFVDNAEEDEIYLKLHTYLCHRYFVDGDQGLYNHAVRSISCTYPGVGKRLWKNKKCTRNCPLSDLLEREERLACIDIPPLV